MDILPISKTKKEILRIALPAVTGFFSLIIFSIIDVFWIAKLGTDAVAGVASSEYWIWAIESLTEISTIGCATVISQSIGAGDRKGTLRAPREAAQLSLLISIFIGVFFLLSGSTFMRWMGLSPAAHTAGWSYLRILIMGLPVFHMILLGNQIFNAHGDTRTVVVIMAVALTVNALMTPCWVFGWYGFPAWGVSGAASATLVGWVVGFALRVFMLRRKGYIPPLREFLNVSTGFYRDILRVGVPTATTHFVWTSVYPLLTSVMTLFGMAPVAGMTIGHRFESVAYFTALGFSIATATLVGQAVGRGDLAAARRTAYEARTLITWIFLPLCAVFLLFPEFLIRLISSDPETVAHGASYLRKIGLLEVFLGWEMVFEGGFNGLGNTRPAMFISVPLTLGRYPAAYFLVVGCGFGVEAVFWCITISTLLKGVLMNWSFGRVQVLDIGTGRRQKIPG